MLPWPRDWPLEATLPLLGVYRQGRGWSVCSELSLGRSAKKLGAQPGDRGREGVTCKGLQWGRESLSQNGPGSLGDPRGHFSEPQFSPL